MRSQGLLHQLNRLILNDMLDVLRVVVMMSHSLQIRSVVVACRRACNLVMDLGHSTINIRR